SVVMHAPGRPVISACAIAAIAAAVSVAVSTNGSPAWPAASMMSRLLPPPGIPKIAETPASRRCLTIESATDGIRKPRDGIMSRRMTVDLDALHGDLRREVRELCKAFPDAYWRELDA